MSLNFNDFISIERHHKKIQQGAQEVRDKYAPKPSETKRYLLDLFDFFLNDIKQVAESIYAGVLHEKDNLGNKFNFTAADLKDCIEKGTRSLLPSYDRIIASYNMGGMFRDVDDFDKEKASFNDEASERCKKQAEACKNQYRKLIAKNRREYWTFIGAVGGMLFGIASVVGLKITLNLATGLSFIKKAWQYLACMFC